MQHRQIANLRDEGAAAAGLGNYSRTPELRVSHKLAERKRRSEMKDLFEDLNKAVPTSGGTKASKWEILSKGKHLSILAGHSPLTASKQSSTFNSSQTRQSTIKTN
jgi:hypothetical protein